MSYFFSQDWLVIPTAGIFAFVLSYLWADKALNWLHKRSLGQREEVLRLMDLMFVSTDRKRVTIAMLLASFGVGALLFIALWPHVGLGLFIGAVVTIIGWSLPATYMKFAYQKRCSVFVDQMVDGMTIMANGIKAGLSVSQAMERVQENLANPISQEFGLVLSQMRIGRSMQDALNDLAIRVPKPDVQMFVTAVNILQETGGNLGETFETITTTIRERQKVEKKIEALTAQGMMQGVIITLVPFFLLIVFSLLDPAFVSPLFNTTFGLIALFVMLTLQVIGGLMIRKVVKINV